jgi:hypothetical protein
VTISEGLASVTKPWKNRNKLETYVFNEEAQRLLETHPRTVPKEDLTETIPLGIRTRHVHASYGAFLRAIIDAHFLSKGKTPTQDTIEGALVRAHGAMPPKMDGGDPEFQALFFKLALKEFQK